MPIFPSAPTPLSSGPPIVNPFEGFDPVKDYFGGAEQRRKYDLARTFKDGLPVGPDGQPDFAKVASMLAQGGDTSQLLPLSNAALDLQQLAQLQGGGGQPSPQGPVAPQSGAPAALAEPRMVGVPPRPMVAPAPSQAALGGGIQQPALSSAGTDNSGDQTMRGMATELAGGKEVGPIIKNVATGLKIDPDAPLTPEQEAQLKPILAKSIAAMQQQGGRPAPAAQSQGSPSSLLPPGNDPRQEIAKLRAAGENLLRTTGPHGARLAQQYFDRADKVESDAFGEIRRAQGNTDREFKEKVRQHAATEMTPVKIGVGAFGEEIYAVKDPVSGGFRMIDPKTGQLGAVVPSGSIPSAPKESTIPAKDLELDRKAGRNVEYLQGLDPEQQGIVRKMANYEMNPTSLSIKGGHRERVLAAVAQFDPNYDQKNYLAFSDGLKKFQSGKEGSSVRAFNVGIEHIDQLLELGRALDNGNIPKINELKNWVKTNIGEDAPTNFNGLKAIVGAEIVKAIVGAGGTGEERAAAAKTVAAASSMKQLEGIAKTYGLAMGAQLGGLQRQYEQSTGRKDFDRLLSPQAIRARDSHHAPAPGGGARAPANDGWSVKEIK